MPKTLKIVRLMTLTSAAIAILSAINLFHTASTSAKQIPSSNPYPVESPAYLEQEKFLMWLMTNDKLGRAAISPSIADRQNLASHLIQQGLSRLPDDLLVKYLPLVSKLLESLDDETCGKFMKNKLSNADFRRASDKIIGAFDADEAKTWFSVGESAIQAELDGSPIMPVKQDEVSKDLMALAASLPRNQSENFLSRLLGLPNADDAEACSVTRILYLQGSRLEAPYRSRVARLLLTTRAS